MVSTNSSERGFTIIEMAVVVMVAAVVAAFATPRIVGAMRAYRLNIAAREVSDTISRAKMLAVSENKRTGMAIDAANRRIGVVTYKDDGTVDRIDYRALPDGITFERPAAPATPEGVTTPEAVSFDQTGGVYRLDFSSRGMPMVSAWGDFEWVFIGNGSDYHAITMTSVGGIRSYRFENDQWISNKGTQCSSEQDAD